MKRNILFLLLLMNNRIMPQSRMEGEYYFSKHEMAAGFNFSADGKFQFFFSYGAVDRNATGTFVVKGDSVKLKSDKQAGKDFTVAAQSHHGNGYTIAVVDANKYLLKDIECIFVVNGKARREYTDSDGQIHVDLPHCDTIYVQHGLYPDIVTLIKDKDNKNNTFRLTLNPFLAQVSFKGIDFKIRDNKTITCIPNYFMEMEDIEFVKQ